MENKKPMNYPLQISYIGSSINKHTAIIIDTMMATIYNIVLLFSVMDFEYNKTEHSLRVSSFTQALFIN